MPDDQKVGPLSVQAQFRLVVSAAGVFVSAGLVLVLANRFLQSSTVGPAFTWLLFGGTGLVGAFILFRVLRATAQGRARWSAVSLTFGGPAAFFAAYMVGGMRLAVPDPPPPPRPVAVVLQMSEDGKGISPTGSVLLSLGKNQVPADIDKLGRATFAEVPMTNVGVPVGLRVNIPGYELAAGAQVVLSDQTDTLVPLKRIRPSSRFGARVFHGGRILAGAKVTVAGEGLGPICQNTDENGYVQVAVPVSPETKLAIDVLGTDGRLCFHESLSASMGNTIDCSVPLR